MVIQAQLNRRRQSRDQRSDVRRKMRLSAAGKTGAGQSEVLIHDLSTTGLLLQTDVALAVGEVIEVALPRTGVREIEIAWSSGSFFGCRFLQPVSPAAVGAALLQSVPDRSVPLDSPEQSPPGPAGFGERLAALRLGSGWTIETVAERLGVSRQAVWYWETGQRLPRAEHFKRIAEVFAVKEQDLLRAASAAAPDQQGLINDLRREVARHNGVAEASVRIVIEL